MDTWYKNLKKIYMYIANNANSLCLIYSFCLTILINFYFLCIDTITLLMTDFIWLTDRILSWYYSQKVE